MTSPRYTGRAKRVREFLAKLRPHGASTEMVIDAIEPRCRRVLMAATLSTLVKQRKLRRADVAGVTRYYATDTTLVDGRAAANAVGKRRKPRAARSTEAVAVAKRQADRSHAVAKAKPPKAVPESADTRPPLQRFCATQPAPALRPTKPTDDAETVDQFLARGGRIDVLATGAVSRPLKFDHRAANEASWQARLRRLAATDI
jgi:hypothetical protein